MSKKLKVAITGASGFVGSALAKKLKNEYEVICLGRKKPLATASGDGVQWRECDLLKMSSTEYALEGVDIAFFLVHSMMPSARLTQASFQDLDALTALNFATAAKNNNIKQIIYLTGIVPTEEKISKHLASRLEVENILKSSGVPVTALRAGLIVGAQGSSAQILFRLVKRLPVMICPKWMRIYTQPIDLEDVLYLLNYCIDNPKTKNQFFDIGGPDVLSYQQMVEMTAESLGKKRYFIPFPYFTTNLSSLWVSLVTGAPMALVKPLVQSLNNKTTAADNRLVKLSGLTSKPFQQSLRELNAEYKEVRKIVPRAFQKNKSKVSNVTSVQRIPLRNKRSAEWVGRFYFRWIKRFVPFLRVSISAGKHIQMFLTPFKEPLLVFEYDSILSSKNHVCYGIKGGKLADMTLQGYLDFVRIPDEPSVLAVIHDFTPRLSWWAYKWSQALVHLWVMKSFSRVLERLNQMK